MKTSTPPTEIEVNPETVNTMSAIAAAMTSNHAADQSAEAPSSGSDGKDGGPPTDPALTGITALRAIDPDALRLWSTKAPKEQTGTIHSVFVEAISKRMLIHERPNGKPDFYVKTTIEALRRELDHDD